MPTLSIYIGESQIVALYYSSPSDFKFGVYPHVYPSALLRHNINEDKFYKQVIKYFERNMGFDSSQCELVVGSVNGRSIPIGSGGSHSILKALNTVQNYSWLLVEDFFVGSMGGGIGTFPVQSMQGNGDSEASTYFSNKSLYPQYLTANPKLKFAHENLLKDMATNIKFTPDPSKTFILTGGKFAKMQYDPIMTYLLAFSLINTPGVFRVKIDVGNKLPLISLLNMKIFGKDEDKKSKETVGTLSDDILNINGSELFDDEFIDTGTVLKAPGGAEVLFEKEAGNSQFIELKKDQMFIFPLNVGETARVSVSGKNVGKIDTTVRGGQLGFVLDGRSYQYESIDKSWIRVFEERVEAF